jgi:hypothetical protein
MAGQVSLGEEGKARKRKLVPFSGSWGKVYRVAVGILAVSWCPSDYIDTKSS